MSIVSSGGNEESHEQRNGSWQPHTEFEEPLRGHQYADLALDAAGLALQTTTKPTNKAGVPIIARNQEVKSQLGQ